jgi:hypothetical protein
MSFNPVYIVYALIVIVTAVALWKGAIAERIGAAANAIAAAGVFAIHSIWGSDAAALPLLIADAALATGFLALAVHYASFWLGGAMLFQAAQFSLHSYYMVAEKAHDLFYFRVNNIDTVGVLAFLLFGAIQSWRRRTAQQKQEAARAAALAAIEPNSGVNGASPA